MIGAHRRHMNGLYRSARGGHRRAAMSSSPTRQACSFFGRSSCSFGVACVRLRKVLTHGLSAIGTAASRCVIFAQGYAPQSGVALKARRALRNRRGAWGLASNIGLREPCRHGFCCRPCSASSLALPSWRTIRSPSGSFSTTPKAKGSTGRVDERQRLDRQAIHAPRRQDQRCGQRRPGVQFIALEQATGSPRFGPLLASDKGIKGMADGQRRLQGAGRAGAKSIRRGDADRLFPGLGTRAEHESGQEESVGQ